MPYSPTIDERNLGAWSNRAAGSAMNRQICFLTRRRPIAATPVILPSRPLSLGSHRPGIQRLPGDLTNGRPNFL